MKNINIKSLLLFIVVSFLTINVVAQPSNTLYKDELMKVEQKLREGNFQGAVEVLDNILVKYPKASELYYAKALLFGQVGNLDVAIWNANEAYSLEPNRVHLNYLIDLYRSKKDWEKVVGLLKEGRKNYPNDTALGRDLIATLGFVGKFDEALLVYNEEKTNGFHTDTLDVTLAEVYFHDKKIKEGINLLSPWNGTSKVGTLYSRLALGYLEDNKVKNAIAVLENGIDKSKDPLLYLDLADAYKIDGKSKPSFEALKKGFESTNIEYVHKYRVVLDLLKPDQKTLNSDQVQILVNTLVLVHPRIAESHMLKGEVLWKQGNTAEARSMFLTAVGISPNQIDAWRMLINVDLVMKKVDDAVMHSKEALSLNPNNPVLLYFAGLAYLSKDENDTARLMLETALNNSTNENAYLQSMIYGSLGDLYHKIKMDAASDVAYEEAIKLDSTNAMAMNNLAYYLSIRKKDLDKAASYSLRSIELEPNTSTFQDTYAWVLFQQGSYAEALKWIEKALKGSSSSSAVLVEHYGDILSQLGKTKDALKQWQKALSFSELPVKDRLKIEEKIKLKKYVE